MTSLFHLSYLRFSERSVCLKTYWNHVFQNDQVLQGFSVDKGEFTCPLCRQFANSVLPCRPGRGTEAGAWHAPSNKSMATLVKEVEDLQEQLGIFPVSASVKQRDPILVFIRAFARARISVLFISSLRPDSEWELVCHSPPSDCSLPTKCCCHFNIK